MADKTERQRNKEKRGDTEQKEEKRQRQKGKIVSRLCIFHLPGTQAALTFSIQLYFLSHLNYFRPELYCAMSFFHTNMDLGYLQGPDMLVQCSSI